MSLYSKIIMALLKHQASLIIKATTAESGYTGVVIKTREVQIVKDLTFPPLSINKVPVEHPNANCGVTALDGKLLLHERQWKL